MYFDGPRPHPPRVVAPRVACGPLGELGVSTPVVGEVGCEVGADVGGLCIALS